MCKEGKLLKPEDLARRVMEVAILLAKGDPVQSTNSKKKLQKRQVTDRR